MRKTLPLLVFALASCTSFIGLSMTPTLAQSQETVVWNRAPLSITVPTNGERLITFPEKVQPGISPRLVDKVTIQTVDDTLYIKALKPFSKIRMPVRATGSDQIFLIDLSADATASIDQVVVIDRESEAVTTAVTTRRTDSGLVSTRTQGEPIREIGYVELTRYASQQLYGPERLISPLDGVSRIAIDEAPVEYLYAGSFIEARPIASWRSLQGLTVTAVVIKNLSNETVELDPRWLRGSWMTATFQHGRVEAKGTPADTTTVYVTSTRPFREAARQWVR